jgi:hypothetical protein
MSNRPTLRRQNGSPRDWLFVAPCMIGFAVLAAAAVYAIYVSFR